MGEQSGIHLYNRGDTQKCESHEALREEKYSKRNVFVIQR
jgi:hypothetical protein